MKMDKISRKRVLWGCVILSAAIVFLSLIVFRHYIFDGYYLLSKDFMSDQLRLSLPTYYEMYDNLFGGDFGFWSWRMGIGTTAFSQAGYYFDPFTYLLFIAGRDAIPQMLVWNYIVRLVFMGIAFYAYISHFDVDRRAAIISSVTYAFGGAAITLGDYFEESLILLYFPLVCLGIELWLEGKRKTVWIVALFLIAIYEFYYYFIAAFTSAVYIFLRVCDKREYKTLLKRIPTFIGVEITGFCLGGLSVLPRVDILLHSVRVSGNNDVNMSIDLLKPYVPTLATGIIRVMGMNLFNAPDGSFMGRAYVFEDYKQITTYVSVFFFVLLVKLFIDEKESRRRIILYGGAAVFLTAFTFFSYLTNAFSTVNYRWMFLLSVLESATIAFALDSICKNGGLNIKETVIGLLASIAILGSNVLLIAMKIGPKREYISRLWEGSKEYYIAILCLWLVLAILVAIGKNRSANYSIICLAVLMSVDIVINCSFLYGDTEASLMEYSENNQACYMDSSATVISDILNNDADFYRINKDFDSVVCYDINSCNDAMAQRYFGLKSYSSFNNCNYVKYLWQNGIYVTLASKVDEYIALGLKPDEIVGQELNYIEGVYDRFDLLKYLGVKYYITKDKDKKLPDSYKLISEERDKLVYRNEEAYPLAFIETGTDEIKREDFKLNSFSSDKVRFSMKAPDDGSQLIVTIPYDRDWHIYVDGKRSESKMAENYLLSCVLPKGSHDIELRYFPIVFYIGIGISIVTLCLCIWMNYHEKGEKCIRGDE